MIRAALARLRIVFPFLLASVSLALLVWAASLQIRRGYDGAEWHPLTGEVLSLDPRGPAAEQLQVGDLILRMQDVPAALAPPLFSELFPGDEVRLAIRRDGSEGNTSFSMANPPARVLAQRLVPLTVAGAFWAIGMAVLAFGHAGAEARPFFRFCLVASGVLGSGSVSTAGPV